jgi:hypothetical protein
MAEKELALCDECGSLFFKGSSQMMGLCQNVPMFSMATRIVTIIFRMAVCELLLGRLKECVHQETESTGGN